MLRQIFSPLLVLGLAGASAGTEPFATLPEAASSFGAVVSDGWLYVYGGHIGITHRYSTASVSGQFNRLELATGEWEKLPGGQALQGMNLASYEGKIYLIGGMSPRNEPDKPSDTRSVAECARYDPKTKKWEALPPLPQSRSSHDVVVVGNDLYVVGGWNLEGSKQSWAGTMDVLDLHAAKLEWKSVPQPFKRRALIAAAFAGKLYSLGGSDEQGEGVQAVSVFDPETSQWSPGPDLPGADMNAFLPAACVHKGELYVSTADGSLYRLDNAHRGWERAGSATPRIAHRIASDGKESLVIGGTGKGKNFDLIEAVAL